MSGEGSRGAQAQGGTMGPGRAGCMRRRGHLLQELDGVDPVHAPHLPRHAHGQVGQQQHLPARHAQPHVTACSRAARRLPPRGASALGGRRTVRTRGCGGGGAGTRLLLGAEGGKVADVAGAGGVGQQVQAQEHPAGPRKLQRHLPARRGAAEAAPVDLAPPLVVAEQHIAPVAAAGRGGS